VLQVRVLPPEPIFRCMGTGDQPLDTPELPEPLQRQQHNPERLEFLVQLGALAPWSFELNPEFRSSW
jgi:hypothetical protein